MLIVSKKLQFFDDIDRFFCVCLFFIFGVVRDVNTEKVKPKLLHLRHVTIIFSITFTDIIVTSMQGPNLRITFK